MPLTKITTDIITSTGASNGDILTADGSGGVSFAAPSGGGSWTTTQGTLGTTSTELFTGLSGVTEFELFITDIRLSGTIGNSWGVVQIGDSGGYETSGYDVEGSVVENQATPADSFGSQGALTLGFPIFSAGGDTVHACYFKMVNTTGNTWQGHAYSGASGIGTAPGATVGGGDKTLTATLDRIRVNRTANSFSGARTYFARWR